MKWNFLYDEHKGKPYQSILDWYADIRHLIWPTIIVMVLGTIIYVCSKILVK